jgi:hypothetical protein
MLAGEKSMGKCWEWKDLLCFSINAADEHGARHFEGLGAWCDSLVELEGSKGCAFVFVDAEYHGLRKVISCGEERGFEEHIRPV